MERASARTGVGSHLWVQGHLVAVSRCRVRHLLPDLRRSALEQLAECDGLLNQYAQTRADILMSDHKRVRESSGRTHVHYQIEPCLPVDIVGIAVLVPAKE